MRSCEVALLSKHRSPAPHPFPKIRFSSSDAAFSQRAENDDSADGERNDGGQCGDQHNSCVQVKNVG